MKQELNNLSQRLEGDLYFDDLMRRLYATDASVYRKLPLAVALPKQVEDLKTLINFAREHSLGLIPRTAGTSLAGQCVGDGIVVDFSKYFTKIISFNSTDNTVTVEPGVVRDQLNNYLKDFGLFFGPNTSTSNRCMIGGMVGNNSSGTTSIKYGVTRDKVKSVKVLLSDGSEALFEDVDKQKYILKKEGDTLEAGIYSTLIKELQDKEVRHRIAKNFPKPDIHRRNTGYAIDDLIKTEMFEQKGPPINLAKLICGSEGTLAMVTEITLKLDALPPPKEAIVAYHFNSIEACLQAVVPLMEHDLYSCEMIDHTIIDLTKHNKTQQLNRQFVIGNPKAILLCELRSASDEDLTKQVDRMIASMKLNSFSYAHAVLYDDEIRKAMDLRKAGLGLLGNMIGDKKAVACIEDTAVATSDLASYISEFTLLMKSYGQNAVYYAHAGAGELHLRPILDLKKSEDVQLFRSITTDVAHLVKKYKGSMSGEHGDGIVRSEFIPLMIGDDNYKIIKRIKQVFDPNNLFNPGKIVEAFPMDKGLRYELDREEPVIETLLDFSDSQGILREAEKCNGSGDCRKLPEFGGTMCPSYRATRNEKDSTRARANALREFLTTSDQSNRFNHQELKDVFDLCLSCKACSSECPSSVDVATLKAEFLYQYQKENGVSLKTRAFAFNNSINRIVNPISGLVNWSFNNKFTGSIIKNLLGVSSRRSLPAISNKSLFKVLQKPYKQLHNKSIYLFIDEFSNYLDTDIGTDAIELLRALNYNILYLNNKESGRAMISNGLLEEAKAIAETNVRLYKDRISDEIPLVGIEPSAIFSFRDEYLRLVDDKESAQYVAKHTYLIEEFLQREIEKGNIRSNQFTKDSRRIKFHGHCHQKALSDQKPSFDILNLPENFKVTVIPSGCCGMAGSFGYEKDKYDISMSIGKQTLFPAIAKSSNEVIIAANGTSCRHQIFDGTGREAKHPVTVLREALI